MNGKKIFTAGQGIVGISLIIMVLALAKKIISVLYEIIPLYIIVFPCVGGFGFGLMFIGFMLGFDEDDEE
ncbi:MAG: hypothetical protein ACTSVB_07920 [Candidatus Heimdallarchaeaceae archaeon]